MANKTNTITLVRHGETYWNKTGIMHGQYDIPLNETGKHQAIMVASELMTEHFDICYCSPLQRSIYTAKEILKYHKDTPLYFDDRLMEIYKGDLEGTVNDSRKLTEHENLEFLKEHGMESRAHFFKRVEAFYADLYEQCEAYNWNILIVAHSGTMKMSMFYFDPPEDKSIVDAYYDISIKNCGVMKFQNELPIKRPILTEYDVDRKEYPYI